jgi:23S rRNA (adenine2030-N6)-methyltransferase
MFSYRHAFHAGNHADVLKHTVLIATLDHLLEKDAALTVVDTHAGAGLYRLDGDYAGTSGEAAEGILRLLSGKKEPAAPAAAAPAPAPAAKSAAKKVAPEAEAPLADAIARYLGVISDFNPKGGARVYPGSPFIIQHLLRDHDKLKLFELHPTDSRTLSANIAQLEAGRQIAVLLEDGFGSATKFLPPPSRRALVLMDPSYEMKTDYGRVLDFAAEALKRFATGTYAIWYPIIPRPEAHDLPRRLKTMATKAGKSWLHATLTVKSSKITKDAASGETQRPGLPASGMFLINPPYTLKPLLAEALPQLAQRLGQDRNATFSLESGG